VEQRQQERKMSRIKSAAGRMANAKLAAGWNSWVELWEERVKARKVSER
jgi:hypothetical protein